MFKFNPLTGKLDLVNPTTGGGGTGDVVGPASATDNAIARYDLTTGKLIQNSVVTIGDTGVINGGIGLGLGKASSGFRREDILLDSTYIQGTIAESDDAFRPVLGSYVTGDSFLRSTFLVNGRLEMGSGAAVADTNLYRDSANLLKTDDSFVAVGTITASNLSGTNTGDQTSIVGITGTKAQFNTAVTDGDFLYVGDVTSNATHTGEVTGATALTVDKTAITNKTTVTAVSGDFVLISDTSDSGNLKKVDVLDFLGRSGGTPAGPSGAMQFNGGGVFGGTANMTYDSGSNNFIITCREYITINSATPATLTDPTLQATNSVTGYTQISIQNKNTGTGASADLIAYPDNVSSSDLTGFSDIGVTSSTFSDAAYAVTGPNEGYFFVSAPTGAGASGNMVLATDSTGSLNNIIFFTGGFNNVANERFRIKSTGAITSFDMEITDTAKGLIIKSPDATRWRIGITNGGELTATSL